MKWLHNVQQTVPWVGLRRRRVAYLVEDLHRFVELYIPQEGSQVFEQVNQQLRIHGPTLEDKTQ